jgi:hypothetical protein
MGALIQIARLQRRKAGKMEAVLLDEAFEMKFSHPGSEAVHAASVVRATLGNPA